MISTQAVTSTIAQPFSADGSRFLNGTQPLERRAHVRVEVRHAGRVGEDVVAVGADHRREVLDDLEHLDGDQQQQRLDAGRQPDAEREHGDERVEVDAAHVRAQPRAPRQPVGVGDVGVEGGPDEVDAGAHAARLAAAVAAGRGVADLVERGRGDRQAEDEQQQLGVGEGLGGGGRDALVDEHEPADREEAGERRDQHPRPEQQLERPRDRARDLRVGEEDLPAQREQRVRALRGLVLVAREQALGGELPADLGDVLGPEPAAEPLRHRRGDRVDVALAVDLLEQPVHERPELDHLPVRPAGEPGAGLVAGALDLAQQLETLRARQGAGGSEGADAARAAGRLTVALMRSVSGPRTGVPTARCRRSARRWPRRTRRRGSGGCRPAGRPATARPRRRSRCSPPRRR